MPVSATFPDDVLLLHRALTIFTTHSSHCERPIGGTPSDSEASDNRIAEVNLGNCGTAMRFLTAYCAQLDGQTTILDGVERMHHRPIGQLVEALREIGAQIEYLGEEGFPPLRIKGCALDKHRIVRIDNPLSTQFISALMLIGANVQTNSTSPYINITREIIAQYLQRTRRAIYSEAIFSEQRERTDGKRLVFCRILVRACSTPWWRDSPSGSLSRFPSRR